MPRKYKKVEKDYTEVYVQKALNEVRAGSSIRKVSQKYKLSFSLLQKRLFKEHKGMPVIDGRGNQKALSNDVEKELIKSLKIMEEWGMGPTLNEFQSIVQDYLNDINITIRQFKNNLPGYDWTKSFLGRHNFVLKKGGMMQIARKHVTADPFTIYGFYDVLEKQLERLDIKNKPQCIWNMDETGFPQDPSKSLTIGTKGIKTVRLTCGASRENITVLAACSASGARLPPMIVFKGSRMQHTWIGKGALDGTMYAATPTGWMTAVVFETFFEKFIVNVEDRPLLLILDGHMSHTSVKTVLMAQKENISILKLPAHCTDLLQPLDVSCFAPLKSYYDAVLTQHVHATGARDPLRRDGFVNCLASVWEKGLSEKNIVAGFKATGIYPIDRFKYNESRLDKIKLSTYKKWCEAGKPLDSNGEPMLHHINSDLNVGNVTAENETMLVPIQALSQEISTQSSTPTHQALSLEISTQSSTPTQLSDNETPGCSTWTNERVNRIEGTSILREIPLESLIEEIQKRAPKGCMYEVTLKEKVAHHGIAAVLASRGKKGTEKPSKRRQLNMKSRIITQEDAVQQIRAIENPTIKPKPKRKRTRISSESSESDISVHLDGDSDSSLGIGEISGSEGEENLQPKKTPRTCREAIKTSQRICEIPIITVREEDIGSYFAVFYTKPNKVYYWGKALSIKNHDDEVSIKFEFLHKGIPSAEPKEWKWVSKSTPDLENISDRYIFYGPVKPEINKKLFLFPDETVSEIWENIKNVV